MLGILIKLGLSSLIRKSSPDHMSTSFAMYLLQDRVKFKFYAAEKHLNYLKDMEAKGETPSSADVRVKWEIIVQDLLFHLVGTIDAILSRINKKYELGLEPWKVKVNNVYNELKADGKEKLIGNLHHLLEKDTHPDDTWLSILFELRNTGTHRNVLNYRHEVNLFENVNTGKGSSGPMRVYFKEDPNSNLEIIPYLEDRIQKMKWLIQDIMERNEILLTP
jgi:hypothetical protein